MKKFATLITAAALVAGIAGSASAQGLAGLGNGVTAGTTITYVMAGVILITVVAEDGTVTTTTAAAP